MKPVAFDHVAPVDLAAALDLLAERGTRAAPLAGGQSLVPLLNLRRVRPDVVVDLNHVVGLAGVRVTAGEVRIGAMTRLRVLESHPDVVAALPVLATAASAVAHPHVRTRATLGGSLCHANPAAELPAAAVALDARLVLRHRGGARVVPAAEFFTGPHTTVLAPGELLTEVVVPRVPELRFGFAELARPGGSGYPLVVALLGVAVEGGVVVAARAAAGGVAPTPVRLPGVEAALPGRRCTADDLSAGLATAPVDHAAGHRDAVLRSLLRRITAGLE
ncbi:FAD binding domain-containing protein [Saccharothrix obliqua]|uniref:FAD binding domain-containing protein n=1 Tax=Saccharothrix obliqua TaxID=2861747 RepID=UPI001C5E9DF2|nr:FAD binding domain-containing protein [Saccharothrix obliqua]MBW4718798.1 FAD binding domain-containing protein [Saccharothrix obliqua]